jgi:hypothetical protein
MAKSFQGLFSPVEVVSTNNLLRIEQDQCKIQMTRIYYSGLFKGYYFAMILLSVVCILTTILQMFRHSKLMIGLECIVTLMLIFEILYRIYMQTWRVFFEQKWNFADVFVVVLSIVLLWIGVRIGGGIGEIDLVSAVLIIITRSFVMIFRLVSSIKKKKDQEIQIIDLNDISEADDVVVHKVKKTQNIQHSKLEEHKIEYQESQVEIN